MNPVTCPRCGGQILRTHDGGGNLYVLDAEPHEDGTVEIAETIGHPIAFVHTQPDLLGAPRHQLHRDTCKGVPHNGTDTSKAAAESLTHTGTESQRQKILTYLAEHGPATDEQISDALNLDGNTVRPRRGELVERGDLYETAERGVTRAGRKAKRWAVTPAAERRTA